LLADRLRGALGVAAAQAGLQVLEAGLQGGNLLLTALAAFAFVGRAVDEDQAYGNVLTVARIGDVVLLDRQFVMLVRQVGRHLAAALLLLGEVRSPLPGELLGVAVIEGTILAPVGGAHNLEAVSVQPGQVLDRKGAAVGDEPHVLWQRQMEAEQLEGLVDGRVMVAVAVQDVAENGHGAERIDDGDLADLERDVIGRVVVAEMGRVEGGIAGHECVAQQQVGTR
jgi:hypothetical protein